MDFIHQSLCLILLFVTGAYCDCGATERKGNQGKIDYNFDSGYQVETCTWTLTPIYNTDQTGTVPDMKTMLIITVNQYQKGLGGRLYLPGSAQFDPNDVGKCFRYKQSWDTKCGSDSFRDVCSTPLVTLDKTTLGKYQIYNLAMMSSASISYQFVKCDGSSEREGTESSEKPPQGECGSVQPGLREGNIHFDFSATTSLETCSWTLTPPSSNTLLPDMKTMLILTVKSYDGGVSGNLYMPDLTQFDPNDVGKCFRYKQSWDTQCGSDSFSDVCSTPLVTLSNKALGKYQIYNVAMLSSASIHYQFVSCEEATGKEVAVTTTTVTPTTSTKSSESCKNDASWCTGVDEMLQIMDVKLNLMKTELEAQEISFFIQKEEVKRLEDKIGQQAEIIGHLSMKLKHLENADEQRLVKIAKDENVNDEAETKTGNNGSAILMGSSLALITMLIVSTAYQLSHS